MMTDRLRDRLMNPPNAVPDTGIDLRRPQQGAPFRPKDITKPKPYPGFWFWPILPTTVDDMIDVAADIFDVSAADLRSSARHQPLVRYRMAAMAICCQLSSIGLARIGKKFGDRDHATVINARKKMAFHIETIAAEIGPGASVADWARAMKLRIDA